jgi:hypothetical protein
MPEAHSSRIVEGSIIRVKLPRTSRGTTNSFHDYLYQVERIRKTLAGDVTYECSHYPIDSAGRSLIALDVVSTQPSGVLLTSNKTGLSCDINDEDDTTVPPEIFIPPDPEIPPIDIPVDPIDPGIIDPGIIDPGIGGGGGPTDPGENPSDPEDPGPTGPPPDIDNPTDTPGTGPVPGSVVDVASNLCGPDATGIIYVYKNGVRVGALPATGNANQYVILEDDTVILIRDGQISGYIIPLQEELADTPPDGNVYRVQLVCEGPDGSSTIGSDQSVTVQPDPFPEKRLVYFFSFLRWPSTNYTGSSYVSVDAPPVLIPEGDGGFARIEVARFDGGTLSVASGYISDIRITRVTRSSVQGNTRTDVTETVSTNDFSDYYE